jgi:uncharacterized protein (DUF433 family)
MELESDIVSNSEIPGGTPCFRGTLYRLIR